MKGSQQYRRNFQIGHISIAMISRHPTLLELAGDWMANFEANSSHQEAKQIRFTMLGYESNERVPFILPAEAKLLYKNENTRYYEFRELWIIILQSATVIMNRLNNKILALTHYKDLQKPEHLEDFMHPLLELMRQNGVYAHHAAAVSLEGHGLLILGKSGQGKTTLSVDLLSRGFDFLADDRCFLLEDEQNLEILGFYEPIRYFPGNVDHIDAIKDAEAKQQLSKLENNKNQLDLHPIFRSRIINKSQLVGIVFPHFSPQEPISRIERMPAQETLISILPLTLVCFDRTTTRNHFDFCVNLTSTLPSVRLVMGQDRENWHVLIKEYLASIPQDGTKA